VKEKREREKEEEKGEGEEEGRNTWARREEAISGG
jgi:hypothetical protein